MCSNQIYICKLSHQCLIPTMVQSDEMVVVMKRHKTKVVPIKRLTYLSHPLNGTFVCYGVSELNE